MPSRYSDTGSKIRPYTLTDRELLGIGRLIRACAEIEDIINLYLCELADLPEGAAIILLGRLPASARLKIIETFSVAKGSESVRLFREAFGNDSYRDIVKARNTVAHGWLLGLTDRDEIAFQVQETHGVNQSKIMATVNGYGHQDFENLARAAEKVIPQLEAALGLGALREKRRSPDLIAHMKSQGKRKRKTKT